MQKSKRPLNGPDSSNIWLTMKSAVGNIKLKSASIQTNTDTTNVGSSVTIDHSLTVRKPFKDLQNMQERRSRPSKIGPQSWVHHLKPPPSSHKPLAPFLLPPNTPQNDLVFHSGALGTEVVLDSELTSRPSALVDVPAGTSVSCLSSQEHCPSSSVFTVNTPSDIGGVSNLFAPIVNSASLKRARRKPMMPTAMTNDVFPGVAPSSSRPSKMVRRKSIGRKEIVNRTPRRQSLEVSDASVAEVCRTQRTRRKSPLAPQIELSKKPRASALESLPQTKLRKFAAELLDPTAALCSALSSSLSALDTQIQAYPYLSNTPVVTHTLNAEVVSLDSTPSVEKQLELSSGTDSQGSPCSSDFSQTSSSDALLLPSPPSPQSSTSLAFFQSMSLGSTISSSHADGSVLANSEGTLEPPPTTDDLAKQAGAACTATLSEGPPKVLKSHKRYVPPGVSMTTADVVGANLGPEAHVKRSTRLASKLPQNPPTVAVMPIENKPDEQPSENKSASCVESKQGEQPPAEHLLQSEQSPQQQPPVGNQRPKRARRASLPFDLRYPTEPKLPKATTSKESATGVRSPLSIKQASVTNGKLRSPNRAANQSRQSPLKDTLTGNKETRVGLGFPDTVHIETDVVNCIQVPSLKHEEKDSFPTLEMAPSPAVDSSPLVDPQQQTQQPQKARVKRERRTSLPSNMHMAASPTKIRFEPVPSSQSLRTSPRSQLVFDLTITAPPSESVTTTAHLLSSPNSKSGRPKLHSPLKATKQRLLLQNSDIARVYPNVAIYSNPTSQFERFSNACMMGLYVNNYPLFTKKKKKRECKDYAINEWDLLSRQSGPDLAVSAENYIYSQETAFRDAPLRTSPVSVSKSPKSPAACFVDREKSPTFLLELEQAVCSEDSARGLSLSPPSASTSLPLPTHLAPPSPLNLSGASRSLPSRRARRGRNISTDLREDSPAPIEIEQRTSRSTANTDTNTQNVYCICRKPAGSNPMLLCQECNEWFHFRCVGMTRKRAESLTKYVCHECDPQFTISIDHEEYEELLNWFDFNVMTGQKVKSILKPPNTNTSNSNNPSNEEFCNSGVVTMNTTSSATDKSVHFCSTVSERHYRRQQMGSASVPLQGGYSLGLSWDLVNQAEVLLNDEQVALELVLQNQEQQEQHRQHPLPVETTSQQLEQSEFLCIPPPPPFLGPAPTTIESVRVRRRHPCSKPSELLPRLSQEDRKEILLAAQGDEEEQNFEAEQTQAGDHLTESPDGKVSESKNDEGEGAGSIPLPVLNDAESFELDAIRLSRRSQFCQCQSAGVLCADNPTCPCNADGVQCHVEIGAPFCQCGGRCSNPNGMYRFSQARVRADRLRAIQRDNPRDNSGRTRNNGNLVSLANNDTPLVGFVGNPTKSHGNITILSSGNGRSGTGGNSKSSSSNSSSSTGSTSTSSNNSDSNNGCSDSGNDRSSNRSAYPFVGSEDCL